MDGGYQIEIVGATFLQGQNLAGQLLCVDSLTVILMTYREVLTENTAQCAAGKENGAGAATAAYGRLFTPVQVGRGDAWFETAATPPLLALNPVDTAAVGAEITGCQPAVSFTDSLKQHT